MVHKSCEWYTNYASGTQIMRMVHKSREWYTNYASGTQIMRMLHKSCKCYTNANGTQLTWHGILHRPAGPAQRMSVMSSLFLLRSVLLLVRHLGGYGLVTPGLLDCLSVSAIFSPPFSIHFTFSSNLNFLLKLFDFFSLYRIHPAL
jgi:hypothetical protein